MDIRRQQIADIVAQILRSHPDATIWDLHDIMDHARRRPTWTATVNHAPEAVTPDEAEWQVIRQTIAQVLDPS